MENKKQKITVPAEVDNLDNILGFVDKILEENDCPMKEQMQIDVAVEEIFVNIAQYAYDAKGGNATLSCEIGENPRQVVLTFIDSGIPYNPLAKEDPDIHMAAEKRAIGGLGIFMVKKTMSEMKYEYTDEKNILMLKKLF